MFSTGVVVGVVVLVFGVVVLVFGVVVLVVGVAGVAVACLISALLSFSIIF